ncbi:MAG: YraN family protein [Candidatus Omnitrophota bacterium]|nr:YraN family protein [Candidatus Omnitrophota bacterium]MDZ4242961.1 YraN family protein [Candidatus Omnitrophota bacterium]
MSTIYNSREQGLQGEDAAVEHLKRQGYRIRTRNFRVPFGEIDVVAEERGVICFVEVRLRGSDAFGTPAETVTFHKRRRLRLAAEAYLKAENLHGRRARFDVVSLRKSPDGGCRIELFRNAFQVDPS